jgi:hypothetical protein
LKKKFLPIILSYFLLSALVLGQVAVSFFHDHDSHSAHSVSKDVVTLSDAEHEHNCKVCSLNIIHELYYDEIPVTAEDFTYNLILSVHAEDFKFTTIHFKAGRAPPSQVFQS